MQLILELILNFFCNYEELSPKSRSLTPKKFQEGKQDYFFEYDKIKPAMADPQTVSKTICWNAKCE